MVFTDIGDLHYIENFQNPDILRMCDIYHVRVVGRVKYHLASHHSQQTLRNSTEASFCPQYA